MSAKAIISHVFWFLVAILIGVIVTVVTMQLGKTGGWKEVLEWFLKGVSLVKG